jgi:hypothetical protein
MLLTALGKPLPSKLSSSPQLFLNSKKNNTIGMLEFFWETRGIIA